MFLDIISAHSSYHHIIIPNVPVAPAFGLFGAWALLAAKNAALGRVVWPIRARFQKNRVAAQDFFAFCRANRAARARFWVARTLPGSILEAETLRFSSVFAVRARAVLTSSDVNKTPLKLMRNAHRSLRATMQKR